MFGGVALSSATPKTCPTCAAVTVKGAGVASTWACGGAPGACRLKTLADGAVGIDESQIAGILSGRDLRRRRCAGETGHDGVSRRQYAGGSRLRPRPASTFANPDNQDRETDQRRSK